jgi:beta-galactosidase/beta-glucuronidase
VCVSFIVGFDWSVAGAAPASFERQPLVTKWAKEVSTNGNAEYPRPTMVRTDWQSLNGEWDFTIQPRSQTHADTFTNTILVPFPVESVLSGTGVKSVTEDQRLWYRRKFKLAQEWKGQRVLLHFEAVNWETKAWLNGHELGVHQGGYDRFSFDITDALKPDGEQELMVLVVNPTDAGSQPRGKQMLHPKEPFFHASSGIWQTVWLEPVPAVSIESLKLVPDIDAGELKVTAFARGETNHLTVEAVALDGGKEIGRATGAVGESFKIAIPNAKLWSPENPFLYDLKITLSCDGKAVDEVKTYFGMRKISVAKRENDFPRLMLNNKIYFQFGPLDQGYWPDGIYTAPNDAALRSDIETMKQLGFNLCRKHVKIEPERWYYWCDKLGLLVWQDMPNGDQTASEQQKEIQRTPESARQFEAELKQMIRQHENHPSIVTWVAFNQGWGQYDTARIASLIKQWDPSRLVIGASGWNDLGIGDVRALHCYSYPRTTRPVQDGKRPSVLGEFGALGLIVPGHTWGAAGQWNVTYFFNPDKLLAAYEDLVAELKSQKVKHGLSAAVITQLTDVETELDGFLTYDRAVVKMPAEKIRQANEFLINAELKPPAK